MEGKTAKPIQSITPPPETENVDSFESIAWDVSRCTPMMNLLKEKLVMYKSDKDYDNARGIQTKIDECSEGITFLIIFYSKVTIHKAKGYY